MIKLSSLKKRYGAVTALAGVSLDIGAGEFVVVTGPSGAGKTTLVRAISLAEPFDEGELIFAQSSVGQLAESAICLLRRQVGVVYQDFKLIAQRTAIANVSLPLHIRGESRRLVREKAMAALDLLGLADRADSEVSALSGGEQQRIAIARALVADPLVIVADEPTGNLDARWSTTIIDLFDQASKRGVTVVMATHDPLVLQYANATRLVELDRGEIISEQCGVRDKHDRTAWQSEDEDNAPRPALQVVS